MPRADLLALSEDDLAALANRGLVKRALRDLESGQGPTQLDEDAGGEVTASWPDGAAVRLEPSRKMDDRCCSCTATTICRHIVGTILAYQRQAPSPAEDAAATRWNPGDIADAFIESLYKPAVLAAIRKEWAGGAVAEVHRLSKPIARLHSIGHTVRFLVPNDLRYTQCDCAEEPPCRHVPAAIWAFRELGPDRESALLSLHQEPRSFTIHRVEAEALVAALCEYGAADLPPTYLRRWEALADLFAKDGLPWLADIVTAVLQAREQQKAGDGRFAPAELAMLAGELLVRAAAMDRNTGAVPQLFIGGSRKDAKVEIGTARLIALGTFVETRRNHVLLTIPLQDATTGVVVSVCKESTGSEPFDQLVNGHFNKQYRYRDIASGQILAKGAKRSPNLELQASRSPLVVHPQSFEWEKLKAPVLAEGFAEIVAHQSVLPPACLRPRRMNEDLYVCPVDKVLDAGFDPVEQKIVALLEDASGGQAWLEHPFYSRAGKGFARLRAHLGVTPLKFIAGRVRLSARGLMIEPCGLVFEENGARWLLQPWTDAGSAEATGGIVESGSHRGDSIRGYLGELQLALGEVLASGFERTDSHTTRRWEDLLRLGEQSGFVRLLAPVRIIVAELQARLIQRDWEAQRACQAAASLLRCTRFSG